MYKVNESEYRFLLILWEKEPVGSPMLVQVCSEQLGWKKSTTYTVIKRLEEKQIVENCSTIVRTLVSKEQIDRQESEAFLEKNFSGNVPAFLASFLKGRKLSREDADKIRAMLDEIPEEESSFYCKGNRTGKRAEQDRGE